MNSVPVWLQVFGSIVSIVVGLTAIVVFGASRRKATLEEGAAKERNQVMAQRVEDHERRLDSIEESSAAVNVSLATIETKLEHIAKSVDGINRSRRQSR